MNRCTIRFECHNGLADCEYAVYKAGESKCIYCVHTIMDSYICTNNGAMIQALDSKKVNNKGAV